jgi:hypothetical protein
MLLWPAWCTVTMTSLLCTLETFRRKTAALAFESIEGCGDRGLQSPCASQRVPRNGWEGRHMRLPSMVLSRPAATSAQQLRSLQGVWVPVAISPGSRLPPQRSSYLEVQMVVASAGVLEGTLHSSEGSRRVFLGSCASLSEQRQEALSQHQLLPEQLQARVHEALDQWHLSSRTLRHCFLGANRQALQIWYSVMEAVGGVGPATAFAEVASSHSRLRSSTARRSGMRSRLR